MWYARELYLAMRNWPAWIPYPTSWMNAILLALIASIIAYGQSIIVFIFSFIQLIGWFLSLIFPALANIIIPIIEKIFTFFAYVSPTWFISPIIVVAFAHHYLNLLLERYFPEINLPEMPRVEGFIPGLLSWWEGIYGLAVILLSYLVSDTILTIIPFFNQDISHLDLVSMNRLYVWFNIAVQLYKPIYTPIIRLFIWIITAAYLYQFEARFRQYLMSVGNSNRTP